MAVVLVGGSVELKGGRAKQLILSPLLLLASRSFVQKLSVLLQQKWKDLQMGIGGYISRRKREIRTTRELRGGMEEFRLSSGFAKEGSLEVRDDSNYCSPLRPFKPP